MKLSLVFTLIVVLISFSDTFAQEEIDIRSLEIERFLRGSQSSVKFTAVDAQENEIIYSDGDANSLPGTFGAENCFPCRAPEVFNTDLFGTGEEYLFQLQLPDNNLRLKFYKTSSDSSLLYLNPRDIIRKSAFVKRGFVKLLGRVEILDSSGNVIAFDNDVALEGNYSISFGKPYLMFRSSPLPREIKMVDQTGTINYVLHTTGSNSLSSRKF